MACLWVNLVSWLPADEAQRVIGAAFLMLSKQTTSSFLLPLTDEMLLLLRRQSQNVNTRCRRFDQPKVLSVTDIVFTKLIILINR